MPAIYFFGSHYALPLYPSTKPIAAMSPSELWSTYVRPMGAGAVAAAGLITLLKTMPTIFSALRSGMKNIKGSGSKAAAVRTEEDLPMSVVIGGRLLLVV